MSLRSKLVVNIAGPNRGMGIVVMHQRRKGKAWCRGYRRCTLQELDLVLFRADERRAHDVSLTKSNGIAQAIAPRKVLYLEPNSLACEIGPKSRVNVNDSWWGYLVPCGIIPQAITQREGHASSKGSTSRSLYWGEDVHQRFLITSD